MEAGFITLAIVSMIIGVMIGIFIGKSRSSRRSIDIQGVLNVDCSDSEIEPGLWLQLQVPIEDVISQKQATFNVRIIQNNSQK